MKSFTFVDVETTGSDPARDRVIEVGLVRVENDEIVDTFSSLVNPNMHIPYFIQQLTGINEAILSRAPLFEEVKQKIREITDESIFVAHNASFDYKFISSEYKRSDDNFRAKLLCTVRLSRRLFPNFKRHNLDSLIQRHAIKVKSRHRAFDDALALWEFFKKAKVQVGESNFDSALSDLLKKPRLPSYIKNSGFTDFPETAGIYEFIGKTSKSNYDNILYIGKSNNLNKRIHSHFTSSSETDLLLSRFTDNINIFPTAGEIGALLHEIHQIKDKSPLLNKSLRQSANYIAALKINENGYDKIKICELKESDIDADVIVGVYKTKKNAQNTIKQICEENNLCLTTMGLEMSTGPCFNYQIEKCFGACVGEEDPIKHNIRFASAFALSKINKWPFSSAVTYTEENDTMSQTYIFDKWSHFATITQNKENTSVNKFDGNFDYDIYKIINKLILTKSPGKFKPVNYEDLEMQELMPIKSSLAKI